MSKTKLGPIEIFGLAVLGIGLIHFILPIIIGIIFILFFTSGFKVFRILSGCDDDRPPDRHYDE